MPKIYYKNVKFRLRETREIKNWIVQVIRSEEKEPGDLSFIFASDKYIKEINKEFLNHNYNTDVIAFDYKKGNVINGEIYLGINKIRKNAVQYKNTILNEVLRVMVHGVLHIIGYDDKTEIEKKKMKKMEDIYLEIFKEKDGI